MRSSSTGRQVASWLTIAAGLAFSLIVLGGIVRLTRAGLSITEWQPLRGTLPPIGDAEWTAAFAKYQATPEYTKVNLGMTMADFRTIFLLEYAHRLLGRVTGLALALPLAYLLVRRRLSLREARPILYVLAAGVGQALLGWLMVASGLVDVPHVSPPRLAAHLVVGIALFAALVWMIVARQRPAAPEHAPTAFTRAVGYGTLALTAVTIAWGGLMAGTHAGLFFSTFPKMGDSWAPFELAADARAIASDPIMIHFTHRALALALSFACVALAAATWRTSRRARHLGTLTLVVLGVQIALGALVVMHHVPISLASVHQANAVVLVGLLTALVGELVKAHAAARQVHADVAGSPAAGVPSPAPPLAAAPP
jgi:cytochrome c oxidase assembly protein subunit 15